MIDRLVHHAEILNLKGDAYRLKDKDLGSPPTRASRRGSRSARWTRESYERPTRCASAPRSTFATMIGCSEDVARSCQRRLRGRMLIEPDGCRPTEWLRTRHGDLALEHQP